MRRAVRSLSFVNQKNQVDEMNQRNQILATRNAVLDRGAGPPFFLARLRWSVYVLKSERPHRLGRSDIAQKDVSARDDADQLAISVSHGNPNEMFALQ